MEKGNVIVNRARHVVLVHDDPRDLDSLFCALIHFRVVLSCQTVKDELWRFLKRVIDLEAEFLTTTEGGTVASICGSEAEMYTCDHLQELNINVLHTVRGCQDPGGFIDHSSTDKFAFMEQQDLQTHNCIVRGWGAETTGRDNRTGLCSPARGIHLWDTHFLRQSEHVGQTHFVQTASTRPCHMPLTLKTRTEVTRTFLCTVYCTGVGARRSSNCSDCFCLELLLPGIPIPLVIINYLGWEGSDFTRREGNLTKWSTKALSLTGELRPLPNDSVFHKFATTEESRKSTSHCKTDIYPATLNIWSKICWTYSPTFCFAAPSINIQVVSICARTVLYSSCTIFVTEMFTPSILNQTRVRESLMFWATTT